MHAYFVGNLAIHEILIYSSLYYRCHINATIEPAVQGLPRKKRHTGYVVRYNFVILCIRMHSIQLSIERKINIIHAYTLDCNRWQKFTVYISFHIPNTHAIILKLITTHGVQTQYPFSF